MSVPSRRVRRSSGVGGYGLTIIEEVGEAWGVDPNE